MTTLTTIAGISLASLGVGIVSGALLWKKCISVQASNRRSARPSVFLIWDLHSLLNVLNRFAVAAERGQTVDAALVYNLSDYLLHSSLLQRESGWSEGRSIENWLLAHLRILTELRTQSILPAINVKISQDIRYLDGSPVFRQLHWFLQRVHTIDLIEIQVEPHSQKHTAKVHIQIHAAVEELNKLPSEELTSAWQFVHGKCSCELRTGCELRALVPA